MQFFFQNYSINFHLPALLPNKQTVINPLGNLAEIRKLMEVIANQRKKSSKQ